MKGLGYGAGYRYAHDDPSGYTPQHYLPESLKNSKWYEPTDFGYEKTIAERIMFWERLKREAEG